MLMRYCRIQNILFVVVILSSLFCLSNKDTSTKQQNLVKQSKPEHYVNEWKPIDFYLIYKMWTDKDLIELRQQIARDEAKFNR